MAARVLVIDDDPEIGTLVGRTLVREGYRTAVHRSGEMGLAALAAEPFDLVITDVRMDGIDGMEICRRVADNEGLPVVILTAYGGVDAVRRAVRAGATDLLLKPFSLADLCSTVARVIASRPEGSGDTRLPARPRRQAPRDLVGSSAPWRRVLGECELVAGSDANVLLVGESGTGKEVIARALHQMSDRRDEPFVAVHCGAVPSTLLESELFGHERGAFTGAERARRGLFLEAGGGTLFLDDVAAMPLALQPKLLRAIQARAVRAVGGASEVPFHARIVAATNVDLELAAGAGRFRADLLYRLDVLRIELPPLRERHGDALELARAFLAELAGRGGIRTTALSRAAEAQLQRYHWPGNVRELRNCVESAVAVARGAQIELADLPVEVRAHVPDAERGGPSEAETLLAVERTHVERVLESVGGNHSAAAAALGISRQALYRKLRRLRGT